MVRLLVLLNVRLVVVRMERPINQEFRLELRVGDFEEVIEDLLDYSSCLLVLNYGIGQMNSTEGLEVVYMVVVFVLNFEQVPNSSPHHFHESNGCLQQDVVFRFSYKCRGNCHDEIGSQ